MSRRHRDLTRGGAEVRGSGLGSLTWLGRRNGTGCRGLVCREGGQRLKASEGGAILSLPAHQ